MGILEFMASSPILTFFLFWVSVGMICRLYKITVSAIVVWKHGYPLEEFDAIGESEDH